MKQDYTQISVILEGMGSMENLRTDTLVPIFYPLAAFLVLHGLVHLLYAGQSSRRFELRPGVTWPDGAWALSPLLDQGSVRLLAAISLVTAALGFLWPARWRCS